MNPRKYMHLMILVSVAGLSGCDELTQTANKSTKPARVSRENRVPVHRFVLTRTDGGVAFDTQTGQICRTWDWQPMAKPTKPDTETGVTPQRLFGEFAPTCLSVYQQYASGTNPQSEEIPDE